MSVVALIEDDPRIREAMARALGERGHAVRSSSTGMAGLHDVVEDPPDVVILDLGLPDLDGREVLKMLRAVSAVPVIVATARDEDSEIVLTLDAGADDYIIKPFRMRELVARIRAVLRRSDPSEVGPRVPLRGGDIVLDEATHTVTVREAPVNLTPTEFNLLRLLMAAPGQVLTRQQLADRLSENGFDGLERTLNVHVRNLRIKVEPDPDNPTHIETVFGVGYRFASRDR